MLRQDLSRTEPDRASNNNRGEPSQVGNAYGDSARKGGIDIQGELEQLKEVILTSPCVPLTHLTLVNEDQLVDQIELVQEQLPDAFREAVNIVHQKEEILLQAEQYAQEILDAAERQATQILDETGIIQRAEIEAQQVWQRVQQECTAAQDQALKEMERLRRQSREELEEMRRIALAECEEIQLGADEYADRVLMNIEQQLGDMLRVIRNGRQQLHLEEPPVPQPRNQPANREQGTGNREQGTEGRGQRAEGRGQRAEGRGQRAEGRGRQ